MKHPFPSSTKNPPEFSLSPAGLQESFDPCYSLLVSATASEIKMEARQAEVSAATVVGTMAGAVPAMPMSASITRAAAMADGAVAIDGMPVTVIARHRPFAVNRSAAGTAVVRKAPAGGAVEITRLRGGWGEDCKACDGSQESDEFFHDERGDGFDLLPHSCGV